jgi:hypothetical protein
MCLQHSMEPRAIDRPTLTSGRHCRADMTNRRRCSELTLKYRSSRSFCLPSKPSICVITSLRRVSTSFTKLMQEADSQRREIMTHMKQLISRQIDLENRYFQLSILTEWCSLCNSYQTGQWRPLVNGLPQRLGIARQLLKGQQGWPPRSSATLFQ